MQQFKIKKGLDLPLDGAPEQVIYDAPAVSKVAVVGPDYHGMKPTMFVKVDDVVKQGQPLFEDKKNPGVIFTAPSAGKVAQINRGAKRVLQSVVIEVSGDDAESFATLSGAALSNEAVRDNLQKSGLWTALRTRPYSKIPAIDAQADAIFVTAIDTNPLAADPAVVLEGQSVDFNAGLEALAALTDGKVFVSKASGADISVTAGGNVEVAEFGGLHPAGLAGTHIHHLRPVGAEKSVWTIGYQDVVAIGHLCNTGMLSSERVIALAGPVVNKPRLIRTTLGASVVDLVDGELQDVSCRAVSGSVLSGRRANGWAAYLGRYHQQISVLNETHEREFMHYLRLGVNKYSAINIFVSKLFGGKKFALDTSQNGSARAMVPIGNFEAVMPLDILPTQLLRALVVGDTDAAQKLGCLELDEEDLALCSFVCSGKTEYGSILRRNLEIIEREG